MKVEKNSFLPRHLIERISLDISRFFCTSDKTEFKLISHILNPYSDVYRLDSRIGAREVCAYLKVPHHTPANETILKGRLKTEFEIMHALAERWRDSPDYGVPAPIAFYGDIPAIVTLEAKGRPLRERYRTSGRLLSQPWARENLRQCALRCGAWLRDFQTATSKGKQDFNADELLDYCETRIQLLLEQPGSGFSSSLASRLVDAMQRTALTIFEGVETSGRHNDFASHNIISFGHTIKVIDFSMFDHGPIAYDCCNFWLELEMLKLDWTYSNGFLTELQRSFLKGYGNIAPHDPAFELARVRYSLNRLLTAVTNQRVWRLDNRYRRRAAEASLNWLRNFGNRSTTAV